MKTIHKYQLEIKGLQHVKMASHAKILSLQLQGGVPCIWAEVDSSNGMSQRTFEMYGTGHPFKDDLDRSHIGTVIIEGLVWHYYEHIPF